MPVADGTIWGWSESGALITALAQGGVGWGGVGWGDVIHLTSQSTSSALLHVCTQWLCVCMCVCEEAVAVAYADSGFLSPLLRLWGIR